MLGIYNPLELKPGPCARLAATLLVGQHPQSLSNSKCCFLKDFKCAEF